MQNPDNPDEPKKGKKKENEKEIEIEKEKEKECVCTTHDTHKFPFSLLCVFLLCKTVDKKGLHSILESYIIYDGKKGRRVARIERLVTYYVSASERGF